VSFENDFIFSGWGVWEQKHCENEHNTISQLRMGKLPNKLMEGNKMHKS
jgi:hypothetical protein